MIHRGEIVERVVRESGYPIAKIAKRMGRSRRHIYNIFENNKASWEAIRDIGRIINHDFRIDFKDVQGDKEFKSFVNEQDPPFFDPQELIECRAELNVYRNKYIDLLEKYNKLLSDHLIGNKTNSAEPGS